MENEHAEADTRIVLDMIHVCDGNLKPTAEALMIHILLPYEKIDISDLHDYWSE